MKKILFAVALAALVLSTLFFAGCKSDDKGDEGTATTTTLDRTHDVPDATIPDLPFQKNLDALTEVSAGKASETVTKNGYTALTTEEGWSVNSGIDYSVYDFTGSGAFKGGRRKVPGKECDLLSLHRRERRARPHNEDSLSGGENGQHPRLFL